MVTPIEFVTPAVRELLKDLDTVESQLLAARAFKEGWVQGLMYASSFDKPAKKEETYGEAELRRMKERGLL